MRGSAATDANGIRAGIERETETKIESRGSIRRRLSTSFSRFKVISNLKHGAQIAKLYGMCAARIGVIDGAGVLRETVTQTGCGAVVCVVVGGLGSLCELRLFASFRLFLDVSFSGFRNKSFF